MTARCLISEHADPAEASQATLRLRTTAWATARARRADALRRGDTDAADAAQRDIDESPVAEHIARLVESAPPLSEAQRAHLATLLLARHAP